MPGNTTGVLFRVTTWGESHGPAIGAVVDGCPAGVPISEDDIQRELDRRRPGRGHASSTRGEEDRVEILSGIFAGKTTGTPVSLLIRNRDASGSAYDGLRDIYRPGHGDYTYHKKYGIRDHRGGGRASGRETAARVAAGAIAGRVLERAGIRVFAFTRELGGVEARNISFDEMGSDPLGCPDPEAAQEMQEVIRNARDAGNTLGGIVEIRVRGCPAGLGEPVFHKIDADLAAALMGIGTVKGVEIGAGFQAARMRGSAGNDSIGPEGFRSNNAGGVLAGITTGQEIVIRAACKPIPSIAMEQDTTDIGGNPVKLSIRGRHDVCVIPRVLPVCEAMARLVVVDHWLMQRAIDSKF